MLKRRKKNKAPLDKDFGRGDTEIKMQLSGNNNQPEVFSATLVHLRRGDAAPRTDRDLPPKLVAYGVLGLIVAVDATADGIFRYQTRGDLRRCDGKPAYLFAEKFDGTKFRRATCASRASRAKKVLLNLEGSFRCGGGRNSRATARRRARP